MIGDISKIDITNLNFSQNEVGDFIKSSKVLYTWEFILEKNYRHKIELQHQRIKGNRTVLIDGQEVSNNSKYTYNYSYSFPLNKHYFTPSTSYKLKMRVRNIVKILSLYKLWK